MRGTDRGFTLIELLVVVAVIGILVAVAIPGLLMALDRSKQTSTAGLLRGFALSLEAYATDNQVYPQVASVSELVTTLRPYSDSLRPHDEWRNPLSYRTDGSHYTVESFGKDGVDGTDVTAETRFSFALDIVVADGNLVSAIQ